MRSYRGSPGFSHWVTNKTSNDDLYMFQIMCAKQEFGWAVEKEGALSYEGWGVIKLSELEELVR